MKALRRGVAGCCSAACSGTMHSKYGKAMQVPRARRACRRSINHGCEGLLIRAPGKGWSRWLALGRRRSTLRRRSLSFLNQVGQGYGAEDVLHAVLVLLRFGLDQL